MLLTRRYNTFTHTMVRAVSTKQKFLGLMGALSGVIRSSRNTMEQINVLHFFRDSAVLVLQRVVKHSDCYRPPILWYLVPSDMFGGGESSRNRLKHLNSFKPADTLMVYRWLSRDRGVMRRSGTDRTLPGFCPKVVDSGSLGL